MKLTCGRCIRYPNLAALFGTVLLALAGGCQNGQFRLGYNPALRPTTDRLMAAYEELASGKFQILADFESPPQGQIFILTGAAEDGGAKIVTERARADTGVGSLKATFTHASQRLVCMDSPEAEWGLHRDWSKYQLLLLSVFSPRPVSGFRVGVGSGTETPLFYEHPRLFLGAGWNTLRIDLGDVGERIDLADVRKLVFWCDPLNEPVDLYFDDLLLVDNTTPIFTPPDPQPGDLYVQARGRRLVVGAVDRFELVFARGKIRQWFDLTHDTARIRNLVGAGSLGPTLVALTPGAATVRVDDPGQWSVLGSAVESGQKLLEATPLWVVVEGTWRFGQPDAPATDASPAHRFTYCIYSDGRIYVHAEGPVAADGMDVTSAGVAFCCDRGSEFIQQVVERIPAGAADTAADGYCLYSRKRPGAADLLAVPYPRLDAASLSNDQDPRACVMYHSPAPEGRISFAAMLRVWPADIDAPQQAGPMVVDYRSPLPIQLDTGKLVRTEAGDLDNDGFSEGRGYYVVQLDGSIARIRLDGRPHLRFHPLFKVVDVAERDVWVYLDGRQTRDLQRDRHGNVLFMIPDVVSREVLIEITSRPRDAG